MSSDLDSRSDLSPKGVSDQATAEDTLNFLPYIAALQRFLLSADPPLTVSVEGKWGAGKSSFMLQLRRRLESRGHVTVYFNPWRLESEEEVWAAFILSFLDQVAARHTRRERLAAKVQLLRVRTRKHWWRVLGRLSAALLLYLVVVGIVVAFGSGAVELFGVVGVSAVSGAALWKKANDTATETQKQIRAYLNTERYAERVAFVERFHESLEEYLDAYTEEGQTVFVFVDDLDRCDVAKVTELVESLHRMISEDSRLVYLLAMDRELVAGAFRAKHSDLFEHLDSTVATAYGDRYIQKFVQVPFVIPRFTSRNVEEFVTGMTSASRSPPTPDSGWVARLRSRFLRRGENGLRRFEVPWSAFPNPEPSPEPRLGDTPKPPTPTVPGWSRAQLQEMTALAASVLDYNPRQLKRFVNLYGLITILWYETRSFRQQGHTSSAFRREAISRSEPTLEQMGKFAVVSLRWPGLLRSLQRNPNLLAEATLVALRRRYWAACSECVQAKLAGGTSTESPVRRSASTHDPESIRARRREQTVTELDERSLPSVLDGFGLGRWVRCLGWDDEERNEGPGTQIDGSFGEDEEAQLQAMLRSEQSVEEFLDFLLVGVYEESEARGESVAREFRKLVSRFEDELDELVADGWRGDGETVRAEQVRDVCRQFFESVGPAAVVQATGGEAKFSFAKEKTVRILLEISPRTSSTVHEQYLRVLEYRREVERHPGDKWKHLQLADLLRDIGQLEEARVSYENAVELDASQFESQFGYANLLRQQNSADAPEAYRLALQCASEGEERRSAHVNFGLYWDGRGEYDRAIEQYEAALEIDENDARALINCAIALDEKGDTESRERAKKQYERVLAADSDHVTALVNYGFLLRKMGAYEEAEKVYEKALALAPEDALLYNNYAYLLHRWEEGDPTLAEALCLRALELDPWSPMMYDTYGSILTAANKFEAAEEQFRRAVELDDRNPTRYDKLADALEKLKRPEDAEEVRERARALRRASRPGVS